MMWTIIALHGRIIIYQNLIRKIAFQKRSCQHRIEALTCLGRGEFEVFATFFFFSFFFIPYFMSRDMSNIPGYQKNEHCVQSRFSLVERDNATLNPKKQHRVHNLLSNPQAAIQLAWVSAVTESP